MLCIKHVNLALKIENMTLPLKELGFNQRVFRMKPATLDFWSTSPEIGNYPLVN